jgi:hypothetical protein
LHSGTCHSTTSEACEKYYPKIHIFILRNLSEFATTETDEKAIAAPAIPGFKMAIAATGIPIIL